MTSILRAIVLIVALLFVYQVKSQGCSDAGFCTIGNFNAQVDTNKKINKHEVDILYTYGTHGKNERYYSPQINYRNIGKNGSFFELRLPINTAKDKFSGASYTGIGDFITTYNSALKIKKAKIDYSLGLRVSLSNADIGDGVSGSSYAMYLQPGLGTTDIVAAVNYNVLHFISVGAGIQAPIFQYNKNSIALFANGNYNTQLEDFRRQPDALLKLTGHYTFGKLKINGGVLGIFHLADDYYDQTSNSLAKYQLSNSAGTTINADLDISYRISNKLNFSLLYALPLQTRSNTPEGLARSKIISTKFTFAF